MAGDEIDRGIAAAVHRVIQIRGAGHALGSGARHACIAFQETAHVVPVASIPLCPPLPGREGADLVETASVPGLCDQLDVAQDGIKGKVAQERGLVHGDSVFVAPEDGGEVKAEPVHTVFDDPVAQAVQDHLLDYGMIAVQRIPAPAEIIIVPVRGEHIVDIVVKTFEGKARAQLIALGGVVEYDIQDHFDPVVMELFDHVFELQPFPVILQGGAVACVRSEEADRVVSPVIQQLILIDEAGVPHLVEFKDRHQLHSIDPQFFEVRDLFFKRMEGPGTGCARGRIFCEAPYMHFIDDEVFHGDLTGTLPAPVEIGTHDSCPVSVPGIVLMSPFALSCHCPGVRVQEKLGGVEAEPLFLVIGTVHPVCVFEFPDIQTEYDHGVHKADPVVVREFKLRERLFRPAVEEEQFYGFRPVGLDGEVHTARDDRGPEIPEKSGTDLKTVYGIDRLELLRRDDHHICCMHSHSNPPVWFPLCKA